MIRIVYSNDTIGYLEPCGCGGRYQGGLARRATAIVQFAKENPNTVILDSGNVSTNLEKLGVICSIMSGMKYDAVGIGNCETSYLDCFLKTAREKRLTVVDSTRDKSDNTVPYLIKKMGCVKVGIVSFGANSLGPSRVQLEKLGVFNKNCGTARRMSDILVLLDQGGLATRNWLQSEAAQQIAPDIVVGGKSNETLTKEEIIGSTHIVPTSTQGKYFGVIDVELQSDGKFNISSRMQLIDRQIPEDKEVKRQIDDYIKNTTVVLTPELLEWLNETRARKGTYTAPETCKPCHSKQYDRWSKSKHASALQTLVEKERLTPDCLRCHSEEFRTTLKNTRQRSLPTGVECATCHASVIPHGVDGPATSAIQKVDTKLCLCCHNAERSPGYDEKKYLKRIVHGG